MSVDRLHILIDGTSSSGKTTLCEMLSHEGFKHISSII
jgi:uridine kinase